MRNAQITIQLELFGSLASNQGVEKICIYADSNNLYEAISAAMHKLLNALQENGRVLPEFGTCEQRIVFQQSPHGFETDRR